MTITHGQKPTIVPSETKPGRKAPMTEAEFLEALAEIRQQRIRAGLPLTDKGWRFRRAAITLESR